jgi:hypothetical protein
LPSFISGARNDWATGRLQLKYSKCIGAGVNIQMISTSEVKVKVVLWMLRCAMYGATLRETI